MKPVKNYISRTGTIVQMKAIETELRRRDFVLVADETPKKKLAPKQYRRWQVEGESEPIVVLLWTQDEGEPAWPPKLVVDDPTTPLT